MGAVTEHLRAKNEALTRLVLEAAADLDDDYMGPRAIGVIRGPEHEADYRARRGEYAGRASRDQPARRRQTKKARLQ